jgi:hypothetical protein
MTSSHELCYYRMIRKSDTLRDGLISMTENVGSTTKLVMRTGISREDTEVQPQHSRQSSRSNTPELGNRDRRETDATKCNSSKSDGGPTNK